MEKKYISKVEEICVEGEATPQDLRSQTKRSPQFLHEPLFIRGCPRVLNQAIKGTSLRCAIRKAHYPKGGDTSPPCTGTPTVLC